MYKIERALLFTFLIGLVFSKAMLSLSIGLLVVHHLIVPNRIERFSVLKTHRLFLWLTAFFLLHLLGLIWTTDFHFAWKDLGNKIILFILPAVLITSSISAKDQERLLLFFILLILLSTGINLLCFFHVLGNQTYDDIRGLSLFGSHIRFALMVVIACSAAAHLARKKAIHLLLGLVLIAYFLFYTVYSQVISGIFAAVVFIAVEITLIIHKKLGTLKTVFGFILVFVALILGFNLLPNQKPTTLPIRYRTQTGNRYTHEFKRGYVEGGVNYLTNVCYEELVPSWNNRSHIAFDSVDIKGQPMSQTILRYMTAKGLYKDSVGMTQLSDDDIAAIEAGNTNPNSGIIARLKDLRFQWEHLSDPNGHSLLQRLEYWKTGWFIIQQHWLLGVGTGDVQQAFDEAYVATNSKLKPENRFRAHNYYLTTWITFGISGIIVFSGIMVSLFITQFSTKNYFGITFVLIIAAGMLIEDTPETLVGISLFAFFTGLLSRRFSSF